MKTHDTWERTDIKVSIDKQEGLFLHGLVAELKGFTDESASGVMSNLIWSLVNDFRESYSPAKKAELIAKLGYEGN